MGNEDSKANAINTMKWDSTAKRHMQLEIQKVLSMVMELVVLWSRWS